MNYGVCSRRKAAINRFLIGFRQHFGEPCGEHSGSETGSKMFGRCGMETIEHGYLIRVTPRWDCNYRFAVYTTKGRERLQASGSAETRQEALDLARVAIRTMCPRAYPHPLDSYPSFAEIEAKQMAELAALTRQAE